MSNTIINWRFGSYHLQVVRFRDWRGEVKMGRNPITWRYNSYHDVGGEGRYKKDWRWFEIY